MTSLHQDRTRNLAIANSSLVSAHKVTTVAAGSINFRMMIVLHGEETFVIYHYDLRKFHFALRIVNVWYSLPEIYQQIQPTLSKD